MKCHELCKQGVVAVIKYASIATPEEKCFERQRKLGFILHWRSKEKGKCLRGGEEQRRLKLSQFIHTNPYCYTYVGNGKKLLLS